MTRAAGLGPGGAGSPGAWPGGGRGRVGRSLLALAIVAGLAGCAGPRIVPLPAPETQLDAARGMATVTGAGVALSVRPSAWRGSPWDLPTYVTPFLVRLANGATVPLSYDHASFRLFDDARFQYTALPPVEVERIFRSRAEEAVQLASASPVIRRRFVHDPFWDWWWWDRYDPWRYYPPPPRLDDIYLRALPVGTLQPGAWVEGFVYFAQLRAEALRLTFEFHHLLGGVPGVLRLPFGIEQSQVPGRARA